MISLDHLSNTPTPDFPIELPYLVGGNIKNVMKMKIRSHFHPDRTFDFPRQTLKWPNHNKIISGSTAPMLSADFHRTPLHRILHVAVASLHIVLYPASSVRYQFIINSCAIPINLRASDSDELRMIPCFQGINRAPPGLLHFGLYSYISRTLSATGTTTLFLY